MHDHATSRPDPDCLDTLTPPQLARGGNQLLASLPEAALAALAPHATRILLPRKAVMTVPDQPIEAACFIESGVASVIKLDRLGERTEICMLGPETFTGAPLVTADGRWPYQTFVQVEQLRGLRVPAAGLRAACAWSGELRDGLVRAVHAQLVQIAEGAVSAAWQKLPARLARWLLMYRDRLGSDRIEVTHEFIALMVGAQRSGITLALHELEGAGLIAASRGLIVVRDVARLTALAGTSYGTAEREAARLLPR